MSGYYAPHSPLREEHIAEEMQVSRTPVRAALQRLIQDGLLESSTRGVVVAGWTAWDVNEIFELRILLEPHAAGLAAERASAGQIAAMDAINDEMEGWINANAADRLGRLQAANNRFHHLLVEAASSGRLKAMLADFLDTPIMIGSFYFYSESDMRQSVDHHRQVVNAIRARNRPFAEQAMAFHLRASFLRFQQQRLER